MCKHLRNTLATCLMCVVETQMEEILEVEKNVRKRLRKLVVNLHIRKIKSREKEEEEKGENFWDRAKEILEEFSVQTIAYNQKSPRTRSYEVPENEGEKPTCERRRQHSFTRPVVPTYIGPASHILNSMFPSIYFSSGTAGYEPGAVVAGADAGGTSERRTPPTET